MLTEKLGELKETVDLRTNKGFEPARQVVLTDRGKNTMDNIRAIVAEMQAAENTLLKQRDEEAHLSSEHAIATIEIGILLAALMVVAAAIILTRHISLPLREVTALAENISVGDLSTAPPSTIRRDEIGVLLNAFAAMASSLNE